MPTPELAAQLADLGGFALFLFTVMIGVVGLYRGWIVPGWIYRQERDARLVAETQALRNSEALQKVAKAMSSERRGGRSTSGVR